MRIRSDAIFISSVLFTIALIALIPHNLQLASTWHHRVLPEGRNWIQNYFMPMGFASLTVVFVGLIVIWAGYIRQVRWAWFVMLVIVLVFAFPVYMLPVSLEVRAAAGSINWSAWFWNAVSGPGIYRDYAKGPLDFVLMLIALFLPIRSFFRRRYPRAQ